MKQGKRRFLVLAIFFLGAAALLLAQAQPNNGLPKITAVTSGGVGYATYSSDGNNYLSGQIGRWDTSFPNGVNGPPVPGLEPYGASIVTIDIDVNYGGTAQFNYAYQTWDGGVWDWYDASLSSPSGIVPIVTHLGYPVDQWGNYWNVPSTPVSIDLTQYKNQHVQFIFSVQQDGYGDQSQGTFDSFYITPAPQLTATMMTSDDHQSVSTGDPAAQNAYFPLGGKFELVLQKFNSDGTTTDVPASYALDSSSVATSLDSNALFPNNVVLMYGNKDGEAAVLQAVHTGTHHLTITPSDGTTNPVSLTINVTAPGNLGAAHFEVDPLLIPVADRKGIPPQYVKGQVQQESGSRFNPQAYRYEPLSGVVGDFAVISRGRDYRSTTAPYTSYRLATFQDCEDNVLAAGGSLLDADVSPRNIYQVCPQGNCRNLTSSDYQVSSWDIISANPGQRWANLNPRNYGIVKAAADKGDTCNYLWTAQTSLSASYGYMQMLYVTAIDTLKWSGVDSGAQNPSYLFDTSANLSVHGGSVEAGTSYLAKIIRRTHAGDVLEPQLGSESDLQDVFRDGWTGYNSYLAGYADEVLSKTLNWLPTLAQSIFNTSGGN